MKEDQAKIRQEREGKFNTEVEDKIVRFFSRYHSIKKFAAEFLVGREARAQSFLYSQVKDVD